MPTCTKCKEEKTVGEMSIDKGRRGGVSSWCKSCRADSSRKWQAKSPKKFRKKEGKPYLENRDYALKYRYNLSLFEYEQLLEQQGYACAICGKDSREMTYHLHVDHCHSSGEVRGLLCAPCNVYLGYIRDNSDILQKAVSYLERKKK